MIRTYKASFGQSSRRAQGDLDLDLCIAANNIHCVAWQADPGVDIEHTDSAYLPQKLEALGVSAEADPVPAVVTRVLACSESERLSHLQKRYQGSGTSGNPCCIGRN